MSGLIIHTIIAALIPVLLFYISPAGWTVIYICSGGFLNFLGWFLRELKQHSENPMRVFDPKGTSFEEWLWPTTSYLIISCILLTQF